jgi:hypothetical protein
MARGEDSAQHPNRQVSRERYRGVLGGATAKRLSDAYFQDPKPRGVPEGWHSGMIKAAPQDTSHLRPGFEGVPGDATDPYDAYRDRQRERGY